MRKIIAIIVVGLLVGLSPLLALPPHIEIWITLFLGVVIVLYGAYEYIAQKEKSQAPQQEIVPDPTDMPIANQGNEYAFPEDEPLSNQE
jgi:hypothetical protein